MSLWRIISQSSDFSWTIQQVCLWVWLLGCARFMHKCVNCGMTDTECELCAVRVCACTCVCVCCVCVRERERESASERERACACICLCVYAHTHMHTSRTLDFCDHYFMGLCQDILKLSILLPICATETRTSLGPCFNHF